MDGHLGVRLIDMPALGAVTDTSRVIGARTGAGTFTAAGLRDYLMPDDIDPARFGAKGDGVTDDRAALQAVLDAGLNLKLGRKTYRCAGALYYKAPCQAITGYGPRSSGGSKLVFDVGVVDCIVADSDIAGVTLYDCAARGFIVSKASYSTGIALRLNKAHGFEGRELALQGNLQRGVYSLSSRVCSWERTTISAMRPGGYCMKMAGVLGNNGGINSIINCHWDCGEDGAGPAALGQEADGLILEGAVATVTTYSLQVVRARRAFWTIGGTEGSSSPANPVYLYNYDFQSDSTGENGIRIDVGVDVAFDRAWVQGARFGAGVIVADGVKKFRYRGYCGGGAYDGFDIGGDGVVIDAPSCGRNSAVLIASGPYASPGNGTHDNAVIRATASDVSILGGTIGATENGPGLARYGVNVELGATKVRLIGVDLTGNLSGAVNDLSDGELQIVACPGVDEMLVARNENLIALGNQGQDMLRVGNLTPGTYPNILRIAGATTGNPPQVLAEGDEADIGIKLSPKGAGLVDIGTAKATSLATQTVRAEGVAYLNLGNQGQTAMRVGAASPMTIANYLHAIPAAAGGAVQIQAQGTDTNIGLTLLPKGTGVTNTGPTATSTLAASGAATFGAGVTVAGALTASTTLTVSGTLTASGALTVAGVATLNGGLNMAGALNVTGAAAVSTNLGVAGATTLTGALTANGAVTVGGAFKANGNAGFFGATPVAKPTVTGSVAGNVAVASLAAALAQLGLITNSTTV